MEWIRSGRLALGLACAALLLVGFDSGSCGDEGGDVPQATNDLRPPPGCGAVCTLWCEFGNVPDANGCPTCACNPDPGAGGTGSGGRGWGGDGAGGHAQGGAGGSSCPGVLCDVWCEYGHVPGPDGCPTCACNPGPGNHCEGLSERACNATSGCLGIYDDGCACSPCPPGVDCFCDCPTSSEPGGPFLHCVLDRNACQTDPPVRGCRTDDDCRAGASCVDNLCLADWACRSDSDCPVGRICDATTNQCMPDPANYECRSDADCPRGDVCEHYFVCMSLDCPPPGSRCVDPSCQGVAVDATGVCVAPDGSVADPTCCRGL